MYKDEIKRDLLQKISRLREVDEKTFKMEICDDCENCDKCKLCDEAVDLHEEIKQLQLDTVYFPLVGVDEGIIAELEGLWGDLNDGLSLKKPVEEMTAEDFEEVKREAFESNVEKYLNFKLAELKQNIKERLHKIKPLRMAQNVGSHISHLYSEAVKCYLLGNFEASCALARAVAEAAEKEVINDHGAGHELGNKKKNPAKKEPWEILKKLGVSQEVLDIKRLKISDKANYVLHRKGKVSDSDALEIIESEKLFLQKLYAFSANLKRRRKSGEEPVE